MTGARPLAAPGPQHRGVSPGAGSPRPALLCARAQPPLPLPVWGRRSLCGAPAGETRPWPRTELGTLVSACAQHHTSSGSLSPALGADQHCGEWVSSHQDPSCGHAGTRESEPESWGRGLEGRQGLSDRNPGAGPRHRPGEDPGQLPSPCWDPLSLSAAWTLSRLLSELGPAAGLSREGSFVRSSHGTPSLL